jgi:hypothetical protein
LRFDLVLNDQGLALVVNLFGELGRDGVVGGGVLHDQTLVALDTFEDRWLLNCPFTNISPLLIFLGVVLLRMRRLPPRLPVIRELLEERSLEGGRLVTISMEEDKIANGGVNCIQ